MLYDGEDAVLALSGDPQSLARRTGDFLKREAKAEIEPKSTGARKNINKRVKSISFKDTKIR